MKKLICIKYIAALVLLTGIIIPSLAQSDYEIVKNFQQRYHQIEEKIHSAKNLEELNSLIVEIDRLKNDYIDHKTLLDRGLYPENFDSSLEKLRMSLVIRNQDFTSIDVLKIENVQLKEQVDELNKRNTDLINQIQQYEYSNKKDKKKIKELENLVAELKSSLKKRDELIVGIVDSLMPQLMKIPEKLSSEDKNKIYTQSEKNNILSNLKRSLQDNIRFIRITSLEPPDLKEIKAQQKKLTSFWGNTGLNLVNVYSEKKVKVDELKEIDSLFSLWDTSINQEAWLNIKAEFVYNGINLVDFKDGEQFTSVVTSFIDNEIKNIGTKSLEESERTYASFSDSTWFKVISPKWIPYLLDSKLLTTKQKTSIDAKITDWKKRLAPASYDWVYILVAVLAVVGVGFMYRKRTSKKINEPEKPPVES